MIDMFHSVRDLVAENERRAELFTAGDDEVFSEE